MVKEDWIVKNWDFLSARNKIEIPRNRLDRLLRNEKTPLTGKFFGEYDFWSDNSAYGRISATGSKALFLRPYIVAPMPEGVKAVYIDPKRYEFDTEGNITGLESAYEFPIFVITG